jgi:hypothetical protein
VDAGGAGRRKAGLEVAARARPKPLDAELQGSHQLEAAPQLVRLVAVERDVQRAARLVSHLEPAVGRELGRELRPGERGGERHPHQPRFAPVGLAHRGEHPGRHPGGSSPGLIALQDPDPQPAASRPPGACKPDHPTTDDDRIQLA